MIESYSKITVSCMHSWAGDFFLVNIKNKDP